jgi:DNA-binding beta-propeller fold protein YncE
LAVIDGATDAVLGTDFLCCPALTSPSGIALDTSQSILYVADTGAGSLAVIDVATMKSGTNDGLLGAVTIGAAPTDVVFHATNGQVYVTDNGGTTVSVVNRQVGTAKLNATLATTIDLGVAPVALGLNPATQLFYVSLANGGLGVIDTATNELVSADFFCCPALASPLGLTVDATTNRLYVAENVAQGQVVVIEAADMKAGTDDGLVTRVAVGASPTHLVVDPTLHRLYVNNEGGNSISVIQAAGLTPASCGDTSGPGGADIPCRCGDIVTTYTVLEASDPVTRRRCPRVGLYVAAGVVLDASSAAIRCHGPGFTTGLWLMGDAASITGGSLHGCANGIFGFTAGSTVEGVTAGGGGTGIFLIGDGNRLRGNQGVSNARDGILVSGTHNEVSANLGARNGRHGIAVVGRGNHLAGNRGRLNGGQGVVAAGSDNTSDFRNSATRNTVKPDCSIENQPPAIAGGSRC